jgi:LuxR family quorum-sensing system transcriptional regulator SolR
MAEFDQAKALFDYNWSIQPRLNELCEPLKLFGITNFAYVQITRDNRCFRIGNHSEYTKIFFETECYNRYDINRWDCSVTKENSTRSYIWNVDPSGCNADARLSAGIWNGITIYRKINGLKEVWAFGGTLQDNNLPFFFLNNLDLLLKYMTYFKSESQDILDLSDKSKSIQITLNEQDPSFILDGGQFESFNKKIQIRRYLLEANEGKFWLTAKELKCLVYKNQGLSAKEVARVLDISNRTVETHLDNIKIKSGMENVSQVLSLCKSEGLL